jgi:hypothetical protein
MELLKLDERPTEFEWNGITFLIKARLTTEDKYIIDTAGELQKDGSFIFHPRDFYSGVVKRMVIGWRGVTEGGKDAPYSFDTLTSRIPGDPQEDLILRLGIHIAKLHGLVKSADAPKENDLKNA